VVSYYRHVLNPPAPAGASIEIIQMPHMRNTAI